MLASWWIYSISYLIGAIPCGWFIARLQGIGDIRQHGSGNIGATNVARVGGKHLFFVVFFLDMIKAYAWIVYLMHVGADAQQLFDASLLLLFGNGYSIFLGFSGGKGVSTTFGILLALQPLVAGITLCVWGFALAFVRTMGIASVIAALSLPLISLVFAPPFFVWLAIIMALWSIWRHRSNIWNWWHNAA